MPRAVDRWTWNLGEFLTWWSYYILWSENHLHFRSSTVRKSAWSLDIIELHLLGFLVVVRISRWWTLPIFSVKGWQSLSVHRFMLRYGVPSHHKSILAVGCYAFQGSYSIQFKPKTGRREQWTSRIFAHQSFLTATAAIGQHLHKHQRDHCHNKAIPIPFCMAPR